MLWRNLWSITGQTHEKLTSVSETDSVSWRGTESFNSVGWKILQWVFVHPHCHHMGPLKYEKRGGRRDSNLISRTEFVEFQSWRGCTREVTHRHRHRNLFFLCNEVFYLICRFKLLAVFNILVYIFCLFSGCFNWLLTEIFILGIGCA